MTFNPTRRIWRVRDCLLLLIFMASTIGSTSAADQRSRWALVASHHERDRSLVDLTTAALSDIDGIELVERQSVDRVLTELKLNADALMRQSRTLQFGELTAADVLVLIRHESRTKEPLFSVRIVEARTGMTLAHSLLQVGGIDEEAERVAGLLKQAQLRLAIPDAKRRLVSILGIRSEEPGTFVSPIAKSLTALLRHDLQSSAAILMLEREQIQHLTAERELTAVEQRLRQASYIVEGGLRRGSNHEGFEVTLRLIRVDGRPTETLRIRTPSLDLKETRELLRDRLVTALSAPLTWKQAGERSTEAKQFAMARDLFRSRDQHEEALTMAEAAYALDPSVENHYAIRSAYYGAAHHFNRIGKNLYIDRKPEAGSARLLDALHALQRFYSLELPCLQTELERDPRTYAIHQFRIFRPVILPPMENETTQHARLRHSVDRQSLEKFELVKRGYQQQGRNAASLLIDRLERAAYLIEDVDQFVRDVQQLVPKIDTELVSDRNRERHAEDLFKALLHCANVSHSSHQGSSSFELRRQWPLAKVVPLFRWLTNHDKPYIRMVGFYGLSYQEGEAGLEAAAETIRALLALPADTPRRSYQLVTAHTIGRLKEAGRANEIFDEWLTRAERAREPQQLLRWTLAIFWYTAGNSDINPEWYERFLALLGTGKFQGVEARVARDLTQKFNARLAKSTPPSRIVTGNWSEYQIEKIQLKQPSVFHQYVGAAVDPRKDEARRLLLVWKENGNTARVGRARLSGGEVEAIGDSFPYQHVGPAAGWRVKVVAGGDAIYVATGQPGFQVARSGGTKSYDQSNGLPSDQVDGLAWLNGQLYIAQPGAFVQFDPDSEQIDLLASNRAVTERNPLDGGSRYHIRSMLADESRKCLWLAVAASLGNSRSGIWKYTPGTGEFVHVVNDKKGFVEPLLDWRDDNILLLKAKQWHTYSPADKSLSPLPSFAPFVGRHEGIVQPMKFAANGHHILSGGGAIYSSDGVVQFHPADYRWDFLGRDGNAVFVGNFATSTNGVWCVSPAANGDGR